ncbi:unnamed protein product [Lactuca virosa]|uniref:Myb/SANT-like DNA-binding domain-containing protein n=1 Tax=Lactuca virosa TaxID=75947 RepID=A0AAU9P4E6_9ASTR|nr:unnamed protein product [Lactuca virosa]
MKGSSGFQSPMQARYQYLYHQPPPQHTGQTPPFQGQPPPLQGQPLANNLPSQPPFTTLKWTDEMVKLMIIAISYIMEASITSPDFKKTTQKSTLVSKETKWKVISMVMSERGYNVTPQQCEDTFLEINKKYNQLIGLLGKPTSCEVFEKPILLDSIEMPETLKHEAQKLLESDQFYYREMCSLHHNNRMFIPHDWEVMRLVFLGLEGNEWDDLQARWARLEEKKLEIQEKRLELEKDRVEWLCLDQNEEMKVEKMRLENEKLKFENARLAFELKRKGMVVGDDEN